MTGEFKKVQLALDSLLNDLDVQCQQIIMDGARAWVQTVAGIVPNWSGMSRASLQPIADKVGISIFAAPVRPGVPNRVAEGRASGSATLHPQDDGGRDFKYFFEWKSTVFHFVYNESHNANLVGFHLLTPGPYNSMRQAEIAFFRLVTPRLRQVKINLGGNIKVIRRIIR
jgi:hypothetical protein